MIKVYKYTFNRLSPEITMPEGAKILHVAMQHGKPTLWALVDLKDTVIKHRFVIRGTGHTVPAGVDKEAAAIYTGFIGTFFDGPFVWHMWKRMDNE